MIKLILISVVFSVTVELISAKPAMSEYEWLESSNRVEKATGDLFGQGISAYRIVNDPVTGQRFKKPLSDKSSNQNSIGNDMDREEGPVKSPGSTFSDRDREGQMKASSSIFINPMKNTPNMHRKPDRPYQEEYDVDMEQDGGPDSDADFDYERVHPPFLKEHLVTAHIRPVWSSYRERDESIGRKRLGNNGRGRKQIGGGPSSIVNIYIVTADNGQKSSPEIQVTTTKKNGSGFIVPIINTPRSRPQLSSDMMRSGTMVTSTPAPVEEPRVNSVSSKLDENKDEGVPTLSGSGQLDVKKLYVY